MHTVHLVRPLVSIVALASLAALAGCSTHTDGSAGVDPRAVTTTAAAPGAASNAVETLRAGGTFMFALDESDVARTIREGCAKNGADEGACYARIRAEAGEEGIRFATDTAGHTVWTSFGPEAGDLGLYIEVPLALSADGARGVLATPAGPARGVQMKGKTTLPSPLRFEVLDATTVIMTDGEKGRLFFHRVAD